MAFRTEDHSSHDRHINENEVSFKKNSDCDAQNRPVPKSVYRPISEYLNRCREGAIVSTMTHGEKSGKKIANVILSTETENIR